MKKLLTLLLTALLAFGVGWAAETYSYTFTSKQFSANGTKTLNEVDWTLAGDGGYWGYDGTKGQQFGSGSSPYKSLTLSTSGISGTITGITVNASTASSASATLSVTVGGSAFISSQSLSTSATSYTGSGSASGSIVISITQTTSKALYIKSISVTYEAGSTPPVEDNWYRKVTSTSDLVAGSKYIIVNEDAGIGMGELNDSRYGTAVSGLTFDNDKVNIGGTDVMELILGGTSDAWTFRMGESGNYLSDANASTNVFFSSQSVASSSTDITKWTITPANSRIQSNYATSQYIRFNSGSSVFGTYGVNAQSAVALYVQGVSEPVTAPTFDPVSGTEFYGSQTVTITSATTGATIYYTLDGGTPTTSSSSIANGGTVTISSSCTIKAIAVAQGYENSTVAEATYTKATVPMPTFSPSGGTYDIGTSVEVSITAMTGASIYYTLDGTDPVATRTAYIGPITISETTTLKAIAVYNGESSEVATALFNFTAPATTCSATIVFDTNGSYALPGTGYKISAGNGIVSNSTTSTTYEESDGIRIGSGKNTGSLTLTLNSDYNKVRKVVINAKRYSNDEGVIANVATSNETQSANIANENSFADYEFSFSGASTNTLTITNSANSKRFYIHSITIYYECTPIPAVTITPPTQTISDAAAAQLTITGENINGNINASLTTNTDWDLNPTSFGSAGGTATLTYTGRALSATNTVTAQASGATDATATVNYVADLWIVTDNGVTGDWHFDGQYGVHMTNNNGIYTADFAVTTPNTFILFARKLGDGVTWNTRYVFGPNSGGDWWLDVSGNGNGTIDTNDDDPIKIQTTGLFTITINANDGTFTITKRSINVTISPEDGTHFTGPSISGTITSDPAGTIEWSTDGTNWQNYTDGFTANVDQVGQSVTVYARSTYNGVVSDVAQATYTRDYAPAPDAPIFSRGSGDVARGTVITITAPEGCTLYVDGQQVNSPYEVTINHSTSISAYCVNDEGTPSETVTNTYTVAKVCEANIVFSGGGTSGDGSTNLTGGLTSACFDTDVDEDATDGGIIASSSTSGSNGRLYIGKGKYGLKFGSSSYTGSLTINLNTQPEGWQVTKIIVNALAWSASEGELHVATSANMTGSTKSLTYGNGTLSDFADYDFDFDGSEITSFTISTTTNHERCYVKSITLVYRCGPDVEAPVITPATGTYYESQTVTISADDGCRIYYTTNGTDPTTSSPEFTDDFNVSHTAGSTTTIKALAVDQEGNESEVTTVVYTWGTPAVTIHPDSRNTLATSINVTLTSEPAGGTIYYTTDGSTPNAENGTQYSGGFTVNIPNVGDAVTVKAVTVINGLTSPVATATYTHVAEVLDVHAPFFSPLQNQTYYGDQTLQIATTTPNADIYYEIVEVSGSTAPSASSVEDPTHASTHYDGTPIEMTVGNSYYVKAIAYVGNYVSTITEGWYTILEAPTTQYYYTNLKDFNDNCPTGVTAHFVNPVQVVYHSTYTNNGEYAEFCYLRDNTDYACVYFGKHDTNGFTIFNMGDWIDGSQISGVTNIWDRNFHIQLGTNYHQVSSWPTSTLGWSEILPEEMTNDVIVAGTSDGDNVWGHYVHLRNTTLRDVEDYGADDPKHTGKINDGTADAYYYDKFYRWSAGTCEYTYSGTTYTDQIQCLGDYDQAFFTAKQSAGAKFDVYGIVDYYSLYTPPFEICPIDFLWVYKPELSLPTGTYTSTQTVTINPYDISQDPDWWAAEDVVIYYKTDDMEEWAVYTPGQEITVNSTTTIQAYAEVPAEKTNGTNYNDYVRSEIVEATYTFVGVEDPSIEPASQTKLVGEEVEVTVTDNNTNTNAYTVYTINGVEYTLTAGQSATFTVTTNTTVTAVSYLEVSEGDVLQSDTKTETYEFIEPNDKTYDLLTTNPVVGNVYVIVNKAANVGLSTTQNATNRAATSVTFTDGTKTVVNGHSTLAEFMLESANAGRYYFRQVGTQNYLVVTTNDYANLMTGAADVNAEAAATVNSSVTSGVDESYPATITFNMDGTNRYLRYYAGGRTFTTYGDATANQDVFLYGMAPAAILPPTITPASQVVNAQEQGSLHVTVEHDSQNPAGAVTYYTTDGSDPRDPNSNRQVWSAENGAFDIYTTTTVKAVTGIAFADTYVWTNVVSETYTFVGVLPPVITPQGGTYGYGSTVEVTVATNTESTSGTVTLYTTDGSDPRNGTEAANGSVTFPVTENTTVRAISYVVVEGEIIWSSEASETYEFETATLTPLYVIEGTGTVDKPYTVADELVGTWAVVKPDGTKLLWAKDQGNISIDKRPAKTDKQKDYVKDILQYEWQETWDESNWVILNFAGIDADPEEFVGHRISEATVEGIYVNDVNFQIDLTKKPVLVNNNPQVKDMPLYTGWVEPFPESKLGKNYDLAYNSFVPANFMTENHNHEVNGEVVGFIAGEGALGNLKGDSLYFVNPKIQEVAHIWAVWNEGDVFTVYRAEHQENQNINAWNLNGTFRVNWIYNCMSKDSGVESYGEPSDLVKGVAYEFHAAVMHPVTSGTTLNAVAPQGTPNPGTASNAYMLYPLDVKNSGTPTAVVEVFGTKTVVGVSYYNLMGQQGSKPFEGINIVVTRYSDGSTSAVKVLY